MARGGQVSLRPDAAPVKQAVLTTYADPARLKHWIETSRPNGPPVIYATGPALDRCQTQAIARAAADAGHVTLWQERSATRPGCFDYKARKLAPAPVAAPQAGNPDAQRLLAELARAASAGEPCPSNQALAEACGLPDKEAARYRFGQLVRAGLILVIEKRHDTVGRHSPRVIEIAATGARTRTNSPTGGGE